MAETEPLPDGGHRGWKENERYPNTLTRSTFFLLPLSIIPIGISQELLRTSIRWLSFCFLILYGLTCQLAVNGRLAVLFFASFSINGVILLFFSGSMLPILSDCVNPFPSNSPLPYPTRSEEAHIWPTRSMISVQ